MYIYACVCIHKFFKVNEILLYFQLCNLLFFTYCGTSFQICTYQSVWFFLTFVHNTPLNDCTKIYLRLSLVDIQVVSIFLIWYYPCSYTIMPFKHMTLNLQRVWCTVGAESVLVKSNSRSGAAWLKIRGHSCP